MAEPGTPGPMGSVHFHSPEVFTCGCVFTWSFVVLSRILILHYPGMDTGWMDGWIPVSRAGLLKKRGITFSESCHSRWCNLSCLVLKIPGSRKSQPPLWLCWSPHYNILNARGSLRPKIQTAGRQVKTTSLLKTNWQLTRKSVQLREIHPMISKPKSQGMTIRQKGAQDHEHTKRKMIGQVQHIRVEHVSCTSGNNKGRN